MNQLYQQIISDIDIRQNLSSLRQEIKDKAKQQQLRKEVKEDTSILCGLLENSDAKTRKNTALLMGDLKLEEFKKPLFEAYQAEEQLFVKSAYLTALRNYDTGEFTEEFKRQIQKLRQAETSEESKKHIAEELKELTELVVAREGISRHLFTGFNEGAECILITNRFHKDKTEEQILNGKIISYGAAVRVHTRDIAELQAIRTYSEMLFVIPGISTCSMEPQQAAEAVLASDLLSLLTGSHQGGVPFYFRVEIKSKMPLDKKSLFARKFAACLEKRTEGKMINSTSNYEFELRFIENNNHTFNLLLKMNTIPDERFSYRKEYVAASIKPVNAALLVALAKDYMVKDAQVLDPFCGVGTMLIERQMQVKANTSYGIDIFAEAIKKAKLNTEAAGQIIHYVNKSYFDFSHEYLFDEIFTNMPYASGHKSQEEIREIYERFFVHSRKVLKEKSTVILYTHDKNYVDELAEINGYRLVKCIEISRKEETFLMILK